MCWGQSWFTSLCAGSSTLGGFLELQRLDSTWKLFIPSCFHVVYPGEFILIDKESPGMVISRYLISSLFLYGGYVLIRISLHRKWMSNPMALSQPEASRMMKLSQPSLTGIAP